MNYIRSILVVAVCPSVGVRGHARRDICVCSDGSLFVLCDYVWTAYRGHPALYGVSAASILQACLGSRSLWHQFSLQNHPFIFCSLPLHQCRSHPHTCIFKTSLQICVIFASYLSSHNICVCILT